MASSESMDDSFTTRVDKVFGSLCPSSQFTTPWSLTNHEVEKKEWNIRSKDKSNRDDETPCSSLFDGLFSKDRKALSKGSRNIRKEPDDDLEELSDDEHSGISPYRRSSDSDDKDVWEIRSSIGLDCTLDYEEEEDEYDRVAEGREDTGDRLYMRDIRDGDSSLNSHNVLPRLTRCRDPRANNFAARIRLKEDEAGAKKLDDSEKLMTNDVEPCNKEYRDGHTLKAGAKKFDSSEKLMTNDVEPCNRESREKFDSEKVMTNDVEPCNWESRDGHKLKSILKKRHNAVAKSPKQVKFDISRNKNFEEVAAEDQSIFTEASVVEIKFSTDESASAKKRDRVPDYLIHPSKYTCYSVDSSHRTDQKSGSQACMEFVGQTEKTKPTFMEGESFDLPTSVSFIPRRKANSSKTGNDRRDSIEIKKHPEVTIAAVESQQGEVVMMEEDEPELDKSDKSERFQKSGRCYRTKSRPEDPIS